MSHLTKLKLKNFGVKEDYEVELVNGLIVIRGGNGRGKCVTGDTLISTDCGLVKIGDIDKPEFTAGFNDVSIGTESLLETSEATKFYKEYSCNVWRVTTKEGYEVSGTANHPLLVYNSSVASYEYKKISDITTEDWLCVDRSYTKGAIQQYKLDEEKFFNSISTVRTRKKAERTELPETVGSNLSAVLGYLVANGSTSKNCVNFSSKNDVLVADFVSRVKALGFTARNWEDHNELVGARVTSSLFLALINFLFDCEKFPTARNKTVPCCVLENTKNNQRKFLSALFDCDSYSDDSCFELITANRVLAKTVSTMLVGFGVISVLTDKKVAGYDHIYTRMTISGGSYNNLLNRVIYDSLKYNAFRTSRVNYNDRIPGLNNYIRLVLKNHVGVKKNGMFSYNNKTYTNHLYSEMKMPQPDMMTHNLARFISGFSSMPRTPELVRLNEQLEDIARKNIFHSKVKDILLTGEETVYDITVPDVERFTANGLVSHNSTIFTQGILYTFFGIQSLEGTVEELSNDNHAVSTMVAEAQYGPFIIRRSKSAATVTRADRKDFQIAGQNEVSEHFRELFGIAKGAERLILVAAQDDLTGVLNRGPAETTKFIEQAAGFYQIDEILEKAKEKLKIYKVDQLEEQIETEKARILELEELVVTNKSLLPDLSKEEAELVISVNGLRGSSAGFSTKILALQDDYDLAVKRNKKFDELELAAETKFFANTNAADEIKQLENIKFDLLSEAVIAAINLEILEANDLVTERAKYDKYLAILAKYDSLTSVWEGSKEIFDRELGEINKQINTDYEDLIGAQADLKLIPEESEGLECEACNRAFDNVADIEKHNKANAEERIRLTNLVTELDTKVCDGRSEAKAYGAINDSHIALVKVGLEEYCLDHCTYPGKPLWSYDVPEIVPDTYVSSRLKRLSDNTAVELAKSKHDADVTNKRSNLVTAKDELVKLQTEFNEFPSKVSLEPLQGLIDSNNVELKKVTDQLLVKSEELLGKTNHINTLNTYINTDNVAVEYHTKQVVEIQGKIKLTKKNQKYLNNMRKARLSVINTVWRTITESVSHRFNEITGLGYRLIKEDKYFKCDTGVEKLRPVYRLSGSEQVSLGIAFREVLKMIFSPNCSFLVFDEPFASMSQERTASAMSAISNMAGQVLVITHEESSELSAQQLIEVN